MGIKRVKRGERGKYGKREREKRRRGGGGGKCAPLFIYKSRSRNYFTRQRRANAVIQVCGIKSKGKNRMYVWCATRVSQLRARWTRISAFTAAKNLISVLSAVRNSQPRRISTTIGWLTSRWIFVTYFFSHTLNIRIASIFAFLHFALEFLFFLSLTLSHFRVAYIKLNNGHIWLYKSNYNNLYAVDYCIYGNNMAYPSIK